MFGLFLNQTKIVLSNALFAPTPHGQKRMQDLCLVRHASIGCSCPATVTWKPSQRLSRAQLHSWMHSKPTDQNFQKGTFLPDAQITQMLCSKRSLEALPGRVRPFRWPWCAWGSWMAVTTKKWYDHIEIRWKHIASSSLDLPRSSCVLFGAAWCYIAFIDCVTVCSTFPSCCWLPQSVHPRCTRDLCKYAKPWQCKDSPRHKCRCFTYDVNVQCKGLLKSFRINNAFIGLLHVVGHLDTVAWMTSDTSPQGMDPGPFVCWKLFMSPLASDLQESPRNPETLEKSDQPFGGRLLLQSLAWFCLGWYIFPMSLWKLFVICYICLLVP